MSISARTVLIGSESLLIECAHALERHGHEVVAVVSRAPSIARWAAEEGRRLLADSSALHDLAGTEPFDILFSVTNLAVLAPDVIALPRRAAINFHDGPLPAYAGLNTPVWALLNGESEHGVTWHLMTRELDRGDILVERRFPIAADETALTLNTKCFEAGIDSFEQLVRALGEGSLAARAQSSAPQRFYRRRERPEPAGLIDWTQGALAIDRLVRALDFGAYANPVAAPKMLVDRDVLVVSRIELLDQASSLPPGSIVAADERSLTIATADQDLMLLALSTPCGRPLAPLAAATAYGLRPGLRLPWLDAAAAARLSAFDADVAAHEPFWQQRLASQQALELPQVERGAASIAAAEHRAADVVLPPEMATLDPAARLASLVAWLGRVADKDSFDIGWLAEGLPADLPAGLYAGELPLRAAIDFAQGLAVLSAHMAGERGEMRRRGSFLTDLVARTPELRSRAVQRDPRHLPVSLQVVDDLGSACPHASSELTIALTADGRAARWIHDVHKLSPAQVAAMQQQWLALALAGAATPQRPIGELPLIPSTQSQRAMAQWQGVEAATATGACVHHLVEAQAARSPQRTALVGAGRSISYAELDRRANHIAATLGALGVGPDRLVGLCLPRGVELVIALLAIHKAGGAYVPLDPAYPADRIAYMLEDSKATVLLTDRQLGARLGAGVNHVVAIEDLAEPTASTPRHDGGARPEHLAYVIYTSGSTGRPKGVMVEHRNVVNFFAGMDQHLGADGPGTWLAVTSLSFDISVLELLWTLAHGYTVVVASEDDRLAASSGPATPGAGPGRPIDFSLFYFSADEAELGRDKYRLLLEGAKFGDRHGFKAVWTPERHFHAFGGLYPNPAVAGAAIAAVTEHIGIRAGSVVLPLHHPARVAEEWSVVDNLSNGRVGISFASGWQPNDFVLNRENFADNKNIMLRNIETVRRLWRGESVPFDGPLGKPVETRTLPRPVQAELPYWVTSAGNPQTFIDAGRIGANVLTHLLGQSVDELAEKIGAYRKAYKEAGHPGQGYVSLMLHSFVGNDADEVRATVKRPLIEYLKTSLNLVKQYAWTFPAFKRREGMDAAQGSVDLQSLAPEEMDALLEYSFERYFEGSGLFGTPQSCVAMIERIKAVGVDDVACLIDFGVASQTVLDHLPQLAKLRELSQPAAAAAGATSLAELMQRHQVTHLQCTPSMARMLAQDEAARPGLAALKRMMVGGEAFPPTLARELASLVSGPVMNMYGPTETTVWSAVHGVGRDEAGVIPLGKPLANQQIYILDSRRQPLPPGVPGELAIGGAGVVRGYFERPQLTAERFVPDTIGGHGRLYLSGDLARWSDDGVLEFLGRLDHQVKLRGYRIELGEIEAALAEQPGVAQAVVLAREDTPGDARLAAYLLPKAGAKLDGPALRDQLRESLPEFMLPAHFVTLAQFPQTPNGKIDRKALPAPDSQAVAAPAAAYAAPENELEVQIAAVWRDVLKLPQVGTRDNFFDLGGHSLLAVQAHRRLRDALQRELSITDIFRFPTVTSLAAFLSGAVEAGVQQGAERAQGRRAAMLRRQQLRGGARV